MSAPIFVTGAAGFIGFHVAMRLLRDGHRVVGIDGFTPYYDVALKEARFAELVPHAAFVAERLDLVDAAATQDLFSVIGPASSFIWPPSPASARRWYAAPLCRVERDRIPQHPGGLSARGGRAPRLCLVELGLRGEPQAALLRHDGANHPVSLYAATKKANEMMAHSYATCSGSRPPASASSRCTARGAGRTWPVYTFTDAIARGRPIEGCPTRGKVLARLHLCGRRRGERRPPPPSPGARRSAVGEASSRSRRRAPRRTGSTISATTAPRNSTA